MTDAAAFRRTCCHEAAHAVADLVLGRKVEYVSSRPGASFRGIEVAVSQPLDLTGFDGFRSVCVEPAGLRADIERRIVVFLAGDIAALYLGPRPESGYCADPVEEQLAREALRNLGPRLNELIVAHEISAEPSPSDEMNARAFADAFAGPDASGHYLEWLRLEARQLVIRYSSAIVRVADALERIHVLSGDQVAALVYSGAQYADVAPTREAR